MLPRSDFLEMLWGAQLRPILLYGPLTITKSRSSTLVERTCSFSTKRLKSNLCRVGSSTNSCIFTYVKYGLLVLHVKLMARGRKDVRDTNDQSMKLILPPYTKYEIDNLSIVIWNLIVTTQPTSNKNYSWFLFW